MAVFRRRAASVLRAVRQGERVTLTYRGEAVARLEPVRQVSRNADDPLFAVAEDAVDSPLGPLSHDDIDAALYG